MRDPVTVTPEADDARIALREAGERLAAANQARVDAMRDIATWAHRGHAVGVPVADMARRAGISTQSVWAILKRTPPD